MNVYLDIDGVLLANEKQPALHVKDFLKYFIDNHDVYQLTTHCKGDANYTVNHVHSYFDLETLELLRKIKPTNWSYSKTEAIDFSKPFVWFDDFIFEFEKEQLRKHNAINSWVKVDLSESVDRLKELVDTFKEIEGRKQPQICGRHNFVEARG